MWLKSLHYLLGNLTNSIVPELYGGHCCSPREVGTKKKLAGEGGDLRGDVCSESRVEHTGKGARRQILGLNRGYISVPRKGFQYFVTHV